MPLFIDTRGKPTLGIGICARCSCKMSLSDLHPDPNYPGLFCCQDDIDQLDPYRLAPRATERVDLDYPRPDVDIDGYQPTPLYANQIFGISAINPVTTWQPNAAYNPGDSITPQNIDDPNVNLPQYWFVCLLGGTSGASAPNWPSKAGVVLGTFLPLTSDIPIFFLLSDNQIQLFADPNAATGDGTVVWLCLGIYPN